MYRENVREINLAHFAHPIYDTTKETVQLLEIESTGFINEES